MLYESFSCSEAVITLDFESSILSSNLSERSLFNFHKFFVAESFLLLNQHYLHPDEFVFR
jgi:hypothetical protein